jgi:hypothetical protein
VYPLYVIIGWNMWEQIDHLALYTEDTIYAVVLAAFICAFLIIWMIVLNIMEMILAYDGRWHHHLSAVEDLAFVVTRCTNIYSILISCRILLFALFSLLDPSVWSVIFRNLRRVVEAA